MQKFKPTISRIRLNPEQAVLTCACYLGTRITGVSDRHEFSPSVSACAGRGMQHGSLCRASGIYQFGLRTQSSGGSS